ncbi:Rrf2 family transcriptional regulator [hydrothermal vent metagenome]|uniref:Rrf2 family transcriptional regulator n=1 Tax=hydrothermal vent metagenome TaxID=652676 RepID=A0A3B1E6F9_9ZZZZ
MLLTKKSEYALLSLALIAKTKVAMSAEDLSVHLNISKSFLAKILQNLARHDILKSHKGVNGGFILIISPQDMTIFNIVVVAEEKIPAVFECSTNNNICNASLNGECTLFPALNNLQYKINDFLKNLTLQDIM